MKENFKHPRREYGKGKLALSDISRDPFLQFELWFNEAVKLNLPDAGAMTLATVSLEGRPSARILLLKSFDKNGFCFFTNYNSRKGVELGSNPYAAMVFFWALLERQVRIEGKVEKIEPGLSDEYFSKRPTMSRIAAAVSPQSQEIDSREQLEDMVRHFKEKNRKDFPRPNFWGGYRLMPHLFEFWQGRKNRLNDRIEYRLEGMIWRTKILAP